MACIAVVILHTFYSADSFARTVGQHILLLSVRNLMMWAVPCFVMVSGALLLAKNRKTDLKKIFSKYILRMVVALIVFSILFSVFDSVFAEKNFRLSSISDGLKNALFNTGWKHMWYLYAMIAIYLMLPFYKIISRNAEKNDILYLLAVQTVFLSIIPLISSISGKNIPFYICVYTIYPFYLCHGYAIHNKMLNLNFLLSCVLVVLSSGVIIIMTSLSCESNSAVMADMLGNYSFPAIIALSAGVYSLFSAGEKSGFGVLDKILIQIDKCSFGIYLIHMAVLKFTIVQLNFNPLQHGGVLAVTLQTVAVFAVSFLIVFLLKKIPLINKLI